MDLGALLKNKGVFITGASSGLGEHFARLVAKHGAHVFIGARRKERIDTLAEELVALGAASVLAFSLDVADVGSVHAAFEATKASGGIVDVVINNAGVSGDGLALDQPIEAFDNVIATNLRGVWLVATEAARRWKREKRDGAVVNIASIQGERVAPGLAAYSASKAAVVHLTRSLAFEWARYGIRVNAIEPGYISTELTGKLWEQPYGQALIQRIPMRRLGKPQDLDGVLLLLATDASSWMTGSVIAVDGGHLVSGL